MIAFRDTLIEDNNKPAIPFLVRQVDSIFSSNGYLTTQMGLEHRPEQESMALYSAEKMDADSPLLFEAGTGVGKSLAYLIPAIMHAVQTERQAVIATHTIALQDQIRKNDLPLCRKLFQQVPELARYADFKTALLVGRGNYLCTTRLAKAINTRRELFQTTEQDELQRIIDWASQTEEGIVKELHPAPDQEVWEWVNADSSSCNRKNCNPDDCFFQKARSKIKQAQIIILNHSLLFSLINAGAGPDKGPGVLFADDFLIIDEAHRVPAVATEHFGHHISSYGLRKQLRRLYSKRGRKKRGLLVRLGKDRDCLDVETAVNAAEDFFNRIHAAKMTSRDTVRLVEPDWIEPTLNSPLKRIMDILIRIRDSLEDGPDRDDVKDYHTRLNAYKNGINSCIALDKEEYVYWLERMGKRRTIIAMRSAPLDIAAYVREHILKRETSVLFTSATLSEKDDMSEFQQRIGARGVVACRETSPFDFLRNMAINIATDVPLPSMGKTRADLNYLQSVIPWATKRFKGGTLVLWTNYSDMYKIADQLEDYYAEANIPFFVQGRHGGRSDLVRWFAGAGNAVLFGTDSFWTGIDIPGPALSHLMITRLPFENPSHPVLEARAEWIRERGGNPFRDMTLPEAVMKFRQGVGRLIRKKDDSGTVTILDSRLFTKEYGRRFLTTLPHQNYIKINRHNRETRFVVKEHESMKS